MIEQRLEGVRALFDFLAQHGLPALCVVRIVLKRQMQAERVGPEVQETRQHEQIDVGQGQPGVLRRATREAIRRGFDTAARQVVIGDGAAWIWRLAAEQFPGAIEIVDIYHAKQHLCDVAKAIYGPGTDLADQWARDRRAELDAGRLCALVAALRIHVETTPEARKCIHYVFGNRHRMRYPQFRAKGLCISSGVVEAGCKQIGDRLKRAGMRWTVAGANAILALRCCLLSGRFEDFWERRATNAA